MRSSKTSKERISDFGAKIGGARKGYHARLPSISELRDMTEVERTTFVVKSNIWPTPDYSAMVNGGMDVGVAGLIKRLRDAIGAKINLRELETARRGDIADEQLFCNYAYAIGRIRDAVREIQTFEDYTRLMKPLAEEMGKWARELTQGNSACDYSVRRVMNASSYDLGSAQRIANKRGWPHTQSPELRLVHEWGITPIRDADAAEGKEWSLTIAPKFKSGPRTPHEQQFAKTMTEVTFKSEEDAVTGMKNGVALFLKAVREMGKSNEPEARPQLTAVKRIGLVDYRNGRDAKVEDFQTEFGFRGGEFGNWMTQEDRRQTLNHAYDAMCDLSDTLEIPRTSISLDGRLAIAFGARGHGHAAAHYEPGRRVFNFTKPSGAGCVAHEWFHALDHELGELAGAARANPMRPYLSENPERALPPVEDCERNNALIKIRAELEAICKLHHYRESTTEEAIAAAQAKVTSIGKSIASWFPHRYVWEYEDGQPTIYMYGQKEGTRTVASVEDAAKWERLQTEVVSGPGTLIEIREMNAIAVKYLGQSKCFDGKMMRAQEGNLTIKRGCQQRLIDAVNGRRDRVHTELWTSLKTLDERKAKPYWTTKCEIAARSFECYIFDSLKNSATQSDYLVHGVTSHQIYPTGDLRPLLLAKWESISGELQQLFGKIKKEAVRVNPFNDEVMTSSALSVTQTEMSFASPTVNIQSITPSANPQNMSLSVSTVDLTDPPIVIKEPVKRKKLVSTKKGQPTVRPETVSARQRRMEESAVVFSELDDLIGQAEIAQAQAESSASATASLRA